MPQIALYIGGAGTGKTRMLLDTMARALDRGGFDPLDVGFASYTRAACDEARGRAADQFGVKAAALKDLGWFRTVHAICHKCLGISKELLTGNREGSDWLKEALQADATIAGQIELDYSDQRGGEKTDADVALGLWDRARNRLGSLEESWAQADECDDRTPDLEFCRRIVDRYEQHKRLDGRCDFTDLLARFSGWDCSPNGAERCRAQGTPPALPLWCFDECQDASRLRDAVCLRLLETPRCQWVYLCGDPFQAIHSWNGADAKCFLAWPADKKKIMPKSYRCPEPILRLGEEILADCTDYWDRGIAPADHEGTVESMAMNNGLVDEIDPRHEWLLIARTNFLARQLARKLDDRSIPWLPTRGTVGGRWKAPVRNEAIKCLLSLEVDAPIDGKQWTAVVTLAGFLPSKIGDVTLLDRGTKKRFADYDNSDELQDHYPWVRRAELATLGATPALIDALRTGAWRGWIENIEEYAAAVEQWGQDAVDEPRVRVGTIHSVKGMEADNVALLTSLSGPCWRSAQTEEGFNEEARCFYVGVTRARRRLIVVNERRTKYRKRLVV